MNRIETLEASPLESTEQAHQVKAGENLSAPALHGLKWTYLGSLCSGVLQVGVTVVMSRLLAPADYGLIAAAGLFLRFGSYFSEMGVGQALVQKPSLDKDDVRAAFTASTGIGLVAAIAMWLSAPFARAIVDNPGVVGVVRLLSLSLAFDGMASCSLNLLRRNLRFKTLSKIEVGSYALSYGLLGIPLALMHSGVWALTAALLCQPFLILCFSFALKRHTLLPSLNWPAQRTLLSFGSKLSFTSFAEYIFFLAEHTVVGRVWGNVVLGLYNRASILANLPGSNLSNPLMKVLFPVFSRAQDDTRRLATAYVQGIAAMSLVTIPVAVGMIPAARDLVLVLLGPQYLSAAPLVQILVLALPLGMMSAMSAAVTNARGDVGQRLALQLVLCVLMWVSTSIAARWGIQWVATVSIAVQGVRLIVVHTLAQKSIRTKWREAASATMPGMLLSLLVVLAIAAVSWGLQGCLPFLRLISEIVVAASVWVAFCFWCLPRQLTPIVVRAMDASRITERVPFLAKYRTSLTVNLSADAGL